MTKIRIFLDRMRTERVDGSRVTLRRGDVVYAEDHPPDKIRHMLQTFTTRNPRDKALKRLIAEHGREWDSAPLAGKLEFRHPLWFAKVLMPGADFVPSHTPLRDPRGRFIEEA